MIILHVWMGIPDIWIWTQKDMLQLSLLLVRLLNSFRHCTCWNQTSAVRWSVQKANNNALQDRICTSIICNVKMWDSRIYTVQKKHLASFTSIYTTHLQSLSELTRAVCPLALRGCSGYSLDVFLFFWLSSLACAKIRKILYVFEIKM